MKKPRLFHASPAKLSLIEPREQTTADGKLKDYFVFAQADDVVAHAYALKNDASFLASLAGSDWHHLAISPEYGMQWESTLHRSERGAGGFIYEVPADTFSEIESMGEWVSKQHIPVDATKARFVTVEDAMRAGIQIFVVRDTDKYSRNSPQWKGDSVRSFFMQGVNDGGVSWLNMERGINPIPPPESRNDPKPAPLLKNYTA